MHNDNYSPHNTSALLEAIVRETIKDSASWLIHRPRTIDQIATSLFPADVAALENHRSYLLLIVSCLLEEGFIAVTTDTSESVWLQRPSADTRGLSHSAKKHSFEKVPPPLFIRREAPPLIYRIDAAADHPSSINRPAVAGA